MPGFAYTGLDARGRTVKGVATAENVAALRATLKRDGVYLTAVTETNQGPATTASSGRVEIDLSGLLDRITPKAVSAFTRLLSTLLIAGVTLPESMTALIEQIQSPRFRGVLSDISSRVNEGSSLADALKFHPTVFPPLYVNMVRAGESSGSLETVLIRLADYMDQQEELKGKVTTAMVYPMAMALVAAFVVGLLMVRVVPQISQMFEDQNATLPISTRIVMATSAFFANYWWLVIAAVVLTVVLFRRWRATEAGRWTWDTLMLKLPLIGDLTRKIAIARFSRTLSTMLASGVQLLEALEIVRTLLGNVVLERTISAARDDIREGESVASALKRSGQFPPLVTHMIAVGERSGQLESMLNDVASTYDREVNTTITRVTAVLEPIMIVVMGGAVGFIVYSIMTPIMQMNQMAGK